MLIKPLKKQVEIITILGVFFFKPFSVQRFFMVFCTLLSCAYHSASAAINTPEAKPLPKCIYIASYAPGYDWQDQLEQRLKQTLQGHCTLKTFHMDSKKFKHAAQIEEAGLKAKAFIDQNQPDIVIVSDDNAVESVLKEHYRNHRIPFIFCGINNSAKRYGLPYSNASGMVEIAPTKLLLQQILHQQFGQDHVAYLTTKGTTVQQNIAAFHKVVRNLNIKSSTFQAHNQEDWRQIYRQLQTESDVNIIILGNNAAFPKWDHEENLAWIKTYNNKLTLATQEWMMPYVALGITKSAKEQGEWAGKAAAAVLKGTPINQLSIVPNQHFQTWINPQVAIPVQTQIPQNMMNQAIPFQQVVRP